MKPALGDRVRDRVTGFSGIVTARTEWLNKCVRILVQPEKLHEGKPIEAQSFDEEQIEILQTGAYFETKPEPSGGPQEGEKRALQR